MTESGEMYLGTQIDDEGSAGQRVIIDADDLTTHGVIVGMTGSGKTGLGVIAVEEALLSGISVLVIDPKGDMANLCLRFPDFSPDDFLPWVDEGLAARSQSTSQDLAVDTAATWQRGVSEAGITADQMRRYAAVPMTVYTPGSDSGVGLDLVGSLAVAADADEAAAQDQIADTVAGLLALIGIQSDPLTGREHILLTNLLAHARTNQQTLDVPTLIGQIQQPPLRKLGVMDLDTFFPAADRSDLALRLNGLLASPTFAAWSSGVPLDIQTMLFTPEGAPRGAVISLAHLDTDEQQFVVTLVLSRMTAWMRRQSGTASLRALIYFDEVFGFVPPVKAPPSKRPILTILKQARAFGVGLLLATQNPVDLDYKAIANAGIWMIGRLQTKGDKDRLLEGMRDAAGTIDVTQLSTQISSLDTRQFVLHTAGAKQPVTFATRWVMSYLAGPMTGSQITEVMQQQKARLAEQDTAAAATPTPVAAPTALDDDESSVPPTVPDDIPQRVLDPAATWADQVAASAGGTRMTPYVAVRVRMRFDEAKAELDHSETFEAVLPVNKDPEDLAGMQAVDYDERDLGEVLPDNAAYVIPQAKIATKTWWNTVERAVRDELYATQTLAVLVNEPLKVWSRPGETREAFSQRCRQEADRRQDEEADKLRKDYASKSERLQKAIDSAQDHVQQLETDVSSRRSTELINIGTSILGGLLGGRKSARGVAADVRRAAGKRGITSRTQQRLANAEGEVTEAIADLQALEEDLAAEVLDLDHRWMEASNDITEVEVDLEKDDVDVTAVTLVWVPSSR